MELDVQYIVKHYYVITYYINLRIDDYKMYKIYYTY